MLYLENEVLVSGTRINSDIPVVFGLGEGPVDDWNNGKGAFGNSRFRPCTKIREIQYFLKIANNL